MSTRSATAVAAEAAEAEALALREAALHALTLEDQSGILFDVATDAIDAFNRARVRARDARKLADHNSGAYNAFG
jgi:hypothetical protein